MHPFPVAHYPTDSYYTQLANKIFRGIDEYKSKEITSADMKRFALAVTAYFEDVISGLGMWRSFIEKHRQLYGKWLPFYDTSMDYYEDEINLEDVKLVLWMNMMDIRKGRIVNPENPFLEMVALKSFAILLEEYESAPANDILVTSLFSDRLMDNFMLVKSVLAWMAERSYLFGVSPKTKREIQATAEGLDKTLAMDKNPGLSRYVAASYAGVAFPIGPLALRAKEWFAEMWKLKGDTRHAQELIDIEPRLPMSYFIHGIKDKDVIQVEDEYGKDIEIEYDSVQEGSDKMLRECKISIASLAKYRGRWHVNGFISFYSPNQIPDPEAEFARAKEVRKLKLGLPPGLELPKDIEKENITPYIDSDVIEKALKSKRGRRLLYFQTYAEAVEWQAKVLGAKPMAPSYRPNEWFRKGAAIFITKDNKMCLFNNLGGINDSHNPFYDKEKGSQEGLALLCDPTLPRELLEYLLEKGYLKQVGLNSLLGKTHGRKLLQDNLRFFLRFIREEDI